MRVLRPLLWLAAATSAFVMFVAMGAETDVPLRWDDPSCWLDQVTLEQALVELARWLGIVLSAYVIVVALLVVLGELAAGLRAVPVARVLRRAAGVVAVPALRRRLVEASTATAITVSAMSAATSPGGVMASSPTVEETIDAPTASPAAVLLPVGVTPAEVTGFGFDASVATEPDGVRVVVQRGDTVWDLSIAVYGFCEQSTIDLVAAASGLEDPNLIYSGQVLVFPPLPGTEPPNTPPVEAAGAPAVPADAATWAVQAVVDGDTLWDILEARYGYVDGDLVWAVAGYNGIEDPSDIAVGVAITLPPLPVLTSQAPAAEAPALPDAAIVERGLPPVEEPAVRDPPPPANVEAAPLPAAVLPPPVWAPPSPTTAPAAPEVPVASSAVPAGPVESSVGDDDELAPWLVGLTGTTLAVGVLGVYRRLRRRQSAAGARAWRLLASGPSARLHRQLVAAADLPLVRWAGQEISGVLFGLGRPTAGPVAVELSDLTGIELLWDAPMPDVPAPWEATPGGWSWRLLYDPSAEVPDAELPAAIPGLVTLGRRDDAQVLVDLEAFGSLSIAGDARAAEDVMRSVVLELGAGDELSDAWVSTVGLGVDGVEHLGRVQARSGDEALTHARGIVADERRVMDDAGVQGTFALRASGPAASREVTVIAVRHSCEVLEELLALAVPRSGLAVVILGAVEAAGLRAIVDGAGVLRLDPLGMQLQAVGVSHEAAANTAVLLDAASRQLSVEELVADDEPDAFVEHAGEAQVASPLAATVVEEAAALCGPEGVDLAAAGDLLAGDDDGVDWERPAPALLVRVLGRPRLEPEPELGRFEQMIVVYVASSGGAASASRVRNAVWGGKRVTDKRFWNLVGSIRSQLGADICPGRSTTRGDVVRLVNTGTDLELLEGLAAQAERVPSVEALPLLMEGLELVYGEPFDDIGCQWAIDGQLTFRAARTIESAALLAVDLALTGDDVPAARSAVSRALVGLPGNELLYRARMRIEAHAGNRAGIRLVYAELLSVLGDLSGDSGDSGDPSPATRQLFERLVKSSRES